MFDQIRLFLHHHPVERVSQHGDQKAKEDDSCQQYIEREEERNPPSQVTIRGEMEDLEASPLSDL